MKEITDLVITDLRTKLKVAKEEYKHEKEEYAKFSKATEKTYNKIRKLRSAISALTVATYGDPAEWDPEMKKEIEQDTKFL